MIEDVFGRVLKRIRTQNGISQEKLANDCGLNRSFISQLELGNKSPTLRTIYKISKSFGITVAELMKIVEMEIPKNQVKEEEKVQTS